MSGIDFAPDIQALARTTQRGSFYTARRLVRQNKWFQFSGEQLRDQSLQGRAMSSDCKQVIVQCGTQRFNIKNEAVFMPGLIPVCIQPKKVRAAVGMAASFTNSSARSFKTIGQQPDTNASTGYLPWMESYSTGTFSRRMRCLDESAVKKLVTESQYSGDGWPKESTPIEYASNDFCISRRA